MLERAVFLLLLRIVTTIRFDVRSGWTRRSRARIFSAAVLGSR